MPFHVQWSSSHGEEIQQPPRSTGEDMKRYQDKHSPTTRKDSTVPSSYSVQQLPTVVAPLSPFLFSHCLALSPSLCHLTSSVSLVCLTDSKSPSLCPRSLFLPCQSPPPLPTSSSSAGLCPCHSPSLACFLSFLSPLSLSLSLSVCLPLTLFFPSPTRSFLPLLLAFCFAAVPLPAHLFFSPPPLLLSHPDSLTPPFSASITPANFPLPSASLSCRSTSPLLSHSLSFCSLSPCR